MRSIREEAKKLKEEEGITVEMIADVSKQTFSGRLSWNEKTNDWEYTAGQYFPTEYRRAAWFLLAKLAPVYSSHKRFLSLK